MARSTLIEPVERSGRHCGSSTLERLLSRFAWSRKSNFVIYGSRTRCSHVALLRTTSWGASASSRNLNRGVTTGVPQNSRCSRKTRAYLITYVGSRALYAALLPARLHLRAATSALELKFPRLVLDRCTCCFAPIVPLAAEPAQLTPQLVILMLGWFFFFCFFVFFASCCFFLVSRRKFVAEQPAHITPFIRGNWGVLMIIFHVRKASVLGLWGCSNGSSGRCFPCFEGSELFPNLISLMLDCFILLPSSCLFSSSSSGLGDGWPCRLGQLLLNV